MYKMVATFNFRVSASQLTEYLVNMLYLECKEELDGLKQLEDLAELQR